MGQFICFHIWKLHSTCNLLGGTNVTFSTFKVQQPTVSASSSSCEYKEINNYCAELQHVKQMPFPLVLNDERISLLPVAIIIGNQATLS